MRSDLKPLRDSLQSNKILKVGTSKNSTSKNLADINRVEIKQSNIQRPLVGPLTSSRGGGKSSARASIVSAGQQQHVAKSVIGNM